MLAGPDCRRKPVPDSGPCLQRPSPAARERCLLRSWLLVRRPSVRLLYLSVREKLRAAPRFFEMFPHNSIQDSAETQFATDGTTKTHSRSTVLVDNPKTSAASAPSQPGEIPNRRALALSGSCCAQA